MTETQFDITKIGIGTKETNSALKPAKVKILGVKIQTKTKEEKEMKSPLVHILVKHPDREEPLELSKIKFIKADKIVVTSLWANLDSEGLISKSSAIAELLRFMKVNTIEELAGKEIEAVEQSKEDLYLCLKAY
jgi:hypothetical protein